MSAFNSLSIYKVEICSIDDLSIVYVLISKFVGALVTFVKSVSFVNGDDNKGYDMLK